MKIEKFNGMVPRVDSELIRSDTPSKIVNAKIGSGKLVPFKGKVEVEVNAVADPKSLFLWHRDDDTDKFLVFDEKASVTESPIAGDQFNRIYYTTETGVPKLKSYKDTVEETFNIKIPNPDTVTLLALPQFEYLSTDTDFIRVVTTKTKDAVTTILGGGPKIVDSQNITNITLNEKWEIAVDYGEEEDEDAVYNVFVSVKVKNKNTDETKFLWENLPTAGYVPTADDVTKMIYTPNENSITLASSSRWDNKIDASNSLTTKATGATLTAITELLGFWTVIVDGSLTIRIGSSDIYVQNINLSSAVTMDEVANLIQTAIRAESNNYTQNLNVIDVLYNSSINSFIVEYANQEEYINKFLAGVSGTSLTSDMGLTVEVILNLEKSTALESNIRVIASASIISDFKAAPIKSFVNYVQTFVTKLGEESGPGEVSKEVTRPKGNDIEATFDSDMTIQERIDRGIQSTIIYRTVENLNGTADYKKVIQIYFVDENERTYEDGDYYFNSVDLERFNGVDFDLVYAGSKFLDFISDYEAGALLITSYQPDDELRGLKLLSTNVMAGYVGSMFHMSEPNLPYSWPYAYQHKMKWDIVAVESSGHDIIVMTKGQPYVLSGFEPSSMNKTLLALRQPCVNSQAVCQMQNAVFYASPDGIVMIRGAYAVLASEQYFEPEDWKAYKPETMSFHVRDGSIYCVNEDETIPTVIFDIDDGLGALTLLDEPVGAVYSDMENDKIYGVDDTKIYQLDAAVNKTMIFESKEFVSDTPISFMKARIRRETGSTVNVALIAKGVEVFKANFDREEFYFPRRRNEINWKFIVECNAKIDSIELRSSAGRK